MELIKKLYKLFNDGIDDIGIVCKHDYMEGLPSSANELSSIKWTELGDRLRSSANKTMEQYS